MLIMKKVILALIVIGLLSACGAFKKPKLEIPLSLSKECVSIPPPDMKRYASLSAPGKEAEWGKVYVRQDLAISKCDNDKQAIVKLVNKYFDTWK